MNLWALIKDIVLTGTGVALIVSQIYSSHPSDALLATGLALTVPSIAGKVRTVLSGPSGPSEGGEPEHTTAPELPPSHSPGGPALLCW